MISPRHCLTFLIALLPVESAVAQIPAPDYRRPLARRSDLEAAAAELAQRSDPESRAEHAALRARLRDGDFRQGDRIVFQVTGEAELSDTFMVRAGPVVEFPQMDPLPLKGLLRSELQGAARRHLQQYLRSADVTATPLIRFGIMGAVNRPGYYYVPADMIVNDVFMIAGGPSANARIEKSTFRRGTVEIKNKDAGREALAKGKSLDELNVQSGDEIRVAAGGATNTLTYVGIVTGLATSVALIVNIF